MPNLAMDQLNMEDLLLNLVSKAEYKASFSARIIQLRNELGINQAEFARKLGIPNSTAANISGGKSVPTAMILSKMAETFPNLDTRWLLTGEGEMWNVGGASQHSGESLAKDLALEELQELGRMGPLGFAWAALTPIAEAYPEPCEVKRIYELSEADKATTDDGLRLLVRMKCIEKSVVSGQVAYSLAGGQAIIKSGGIADVNRHGVEAIRTLAQDIIPATEEGAGKLFTAVLRLPSGGRTFARAVFESVLTQSKEKQDTAGDETVTLLLGVAVDDGNG